MKNALKRSLSILLAITIIFSSAYVGLSEVDFSRINFNGLFTIKAKAVTAGDLTFAGNGFPWGWYVYDCNEDASGSITIPATYYDRSVMEISADAFNNCKKLTAINVTEDNRYFSSIDGVLFNKDKTVLIRYPEGKTNTAYTIPYGVTNIAECAFYGCEYLTSITIPNSVTNISKSAFEGCTSLSSVSLGDNVTYIGERAFMNCSSIVSIDIPDSVEKIGYYAFYNCTGLKEVHIKDVAEWCQIDFSYEAGNPLLYARDLYLNGELVTDLVVPNTINHIQGYAFYNCRSIETITIPNCVMQIGEKAFELCENLVSYNVVDSESDKTGFQFSMNADGKSYAITGCNTKSFKYIFVPSNYNGLPVTEIGESAFAGCEILTTVIIKDNIKIIEDNAFKDCKRLSSISISDSVTSIGLNAFENTAFYNNKESWENDILYINNYIIDTKSTIYGVVSIKEGTKTIADSAFKDCSRITEVLVPNSLVSIGYSAFYNCTGINSINLPDGLISIGDSAFYCCTGLVEISIPDSVTSMKPLTFAGCDNLTVTANCNSYASNYIAKQNIKSNLIHNYSDDWTVDIPATNTTVGSKSRHCLNCDAKTDIIEIPVIEHSFSEWQIRKAATCTEDGIEYKVCSICKTEETRVVLKLGHEFSTEWTIDVASTCTEAGSKSHHCSRCEEKSDVTAIIALGHNYKTTNSLNTHPHTITKECTICHDVEAENPKYAGCMECQFTITALNVSSYKVVSYTSNAKDVVIPGTYNNCAVTTLAKGCFKNNSNVESVNIGVGVTTIESLCFMNCTSLTEVYIPATVTTINANAFYNFTGTIYCTEGSAAQDYANANNIDYEIIHISATDKSTIDYKNMVIFTTAYACEDLSEMFVEESSVMSIGIGSLILGSTEIYGTGSEISLFKGNEYLGDFKVVVNGDLTGDGVCNVLDAFEAERASNGHLELEGAFAMAADSNSDDTIDINDYQAIVNKALAS